MLGRLTLTQNKRFWDIYDRVRKRAEKEGWASLGDV